MVYPSPSVTLPLSEYLVVDGNQGIGLKVNLNPHREKYVHWWSVRSCLQVAGMEEEPLLQRADSVLCTVYQVSIPDPLRDPSPQPSTSSSTFDVSWNPPPPHQPIPPHTSHPPVGPLSEGCENRLVQGNRSLTSRF